MTKSTYALYRCSPLLWAGLKYEDALEFRIEKARLAMTYYKHEAEKVMQDSDKYKEFVDKFMDSDNAKKWNESFLEEIIIERERIKIENRNI